MMGVLFVWCMVWSVHDVGMVYVWLVLVYVWYAFCGSGVCSEYIISIYCMGCVECVCCVY